MTGVRVSKAIGIDLGTTNSAVAVMTPTDTEIVIHRHPDSRAETTPSCVWKDPRSGAIAIGREARKRIGSRQPPVRSIKRMMGRGETVRMTDEDISPERVSALILEEMKRQIETDVEAFSTASRRWLVDRAVVTVPAYFDQPSIDATRRAAEIAGLELLDLLHEPTAAACYHCWRTRTQDGVFLVYDLGGGTFDVAVLRSKAGRFEVLGVSGHTRLGGDDLDVLIGERISERLERADYSLNLERDSDEGLLTRALLARMGENVKIGLAQSGEYVLRDAMGMKDAEGNTIDGFEAWFERPEIDALVRPTLERTIPYCFDALDQAHQRADVTLADVDAIVLAGGSTHMPLVRELVRLHLCALDGARPHEDELADPRAAGPRAKCAEPVYERVDAIVALGAAVRAAESGLAVYDAAGRVRVSFRGVGVTNAEQTHLGGHVEALEAGLDIAGGAVRLRIPELRHEDEEPLSDSGRFAFEELPLQPSTENELIFDIYDADGDLVATVGRPMRHLTNGPPPPVPVTAVLSKPLLIEVLHEGERRRHVLVDELTTLPHSSDHVFGHPGATERVLVSLYQGKRKIHEVDVDVPSSLHQGAPVDLNVEIDKLSFITVRGSIGQEPFSVALKLPPPRDPPPAREFAELEQRFEEAVGYLDPGPANTARQKWLKRKAAYLEALERGDLVQAVHEFEELEELVAELSPGPSQLRPPKVEFDDKVRDAHELNDYVAKQNGERHDTRGMQLNIEAQRDAGERAFLERNQLRYGDALEALDDLIHHLRGLIDPRPEPTLTPAQIAKLNLDILERNLPSAVQRAQGRNNVAIEAELGQLQARVKALRPLVTERPHDVIDETISIDNELQRLLRLIDRDDDDDPPLPIYLGR